MDNEIKRFYDQNYDDVYYSGVSGLVSNAMHRALEVGQDDRHYSEVLELGAGHGEHLQFVRHTFDTYYLTDIESHWQRINPHGKHVINERQDATALTYPDSKFDRVLHACLLHHIQRPEVALSEMRRVTKTGGVLTLYVSCDPGLVYRIGQRVFARPRIRKALTEKAFDFTPEYWKAVEHRSYYTGISALIKNVFRKDVIRQRCYPFYFDFPDLNIFTIFEIRKS